MRTLTITLSFSLVFICSACITTKQSRPYPCTAQLKSGDHILITPLPNKDADESANWFNFTQNLLAKHGIISTYSANNMSLFNKGIINPTDTAYWTKLKDLGFTHILMVQHSEQKANSSSETLTEIERNQWPGSDKEPDLEDHATVYLTLYSLPKSKPAYRVLSKAETVTYANRKENGDTRYFNYGTSGMASGSALRKAVKNMLIACDGK